MKVKNSKHKKLPKSLKKQKEKFKDCPKKKHSVSQQQVSSDDELSFEESDNDEMPYCEDYEKKARYNPEQANIRNLLPIKSKKGLEFRSVIVPDEEVDDPQTEIESENSETVNRKLSLVQCYALQQQNLANLKNEVAMLCTSVVEDPETNMNLLKNLITLLQSPNSVLMVSEKTIVSYSLLHVFVDICPTYAIRLEEESNVKLKKETKKLLNYEQNLLSYYKKYIDCLQGMVQEIKSKTKVSIARKKALRKIGLVALKCLCKLLAKRFMFNYFKNILTILISNLSCEDEEVTAMCCNAFGIVFTNDTLGEFSYEIVRTVAKYTKSRKFIIPVDVIKCFHNLSLKEAVVEEFKKKVDMNKVRKQINMMSRTKRKQNKKFQKVSRELREAEPEENAENVSRFHTRTINKVFWVYFHVLKDSNKKSLISPVLDGLAHFAFLINIEFFNDLYCVMCGLMDKGILTDTEKLRCLHALFSILAGQAESLNIDPQRLYVYMYKILLNLCEMQFQGNDQFSLTLKCIYRMILRKRKCTTFSRMVAFVKRLSIVSLHTPLHGTLGLLALIRLLLLNIRGSDILLDAESMIGNSVYLPELEDPEYCNAKTTALWELHFLKNHYHPLIQSYARHILCGCPNQGKFSLPDELDKSPEKLLWSLADVSAFHHIQGFEEIEEPPKKKIRRSDLPDPEFEEMPCNLSWLMMEEIDFKKSLVIKEDV